MPDSGYFFIGKLRGLPYGMNVKSERLVKKEFKCFGQSNFEHGIVINLHGKDGRKNGYKKRCNSEKFSFGHANKLIYFLKKQWYRIYESTKD